MKINKATLALENTRLSHENTLLNLAVSDLLAQKVKWFRRGNIMLGVSRETGAAGGIVITRQQINDGKGFEFTGVYYWESYRSGIAARSYSSDDADAIPLRQAINDAAAYVSKAQAEFYAPRVAEAVLGQVECTNP